jgi:hypothetical protein
MTTRDAARILYFEGMQQIKISKLLNVDNSTVTRWKKQDDWEDKLKKRNQLMETNADIVQELISYQLRALRARINNWEALEDEEPKLIGKGEIDALSKLYATIKKKDVEWTNYVQIMKEFMSWIQLKDLDLAKNLVEYSNEFLNDKRADL